MKKKYKDMRDLAKETMTSPWTRSDLGNALGIDETECSTLVREWLRDGIITQGSGIPTPYSFSAPSLPDTEQTEQTVALLPITSQWIRWVPALLMGVIFTMMIGVFAWNLIIPTDENQQYAGTWMVRRYDVTQQPVSVTPMPTPTVWGTPILGDTQGFYGVGGDGAMILPKGTQVRIIGRTGDSYWIQIETKDGVFWVSMFDLYKIPVETLHDHATPTVIPTPIVQVQYIPHEVPVYIELPAPPPVIEQVTVVETVVETVVVEVAVQAATPIPAYNPNEPPPILEDGLPLMRDRDGALAQQQP
jgi:hypothetical protein